MKNLITFAFIFAVGLAPSILNAHETVNFEYICSVYQRNKEGRFSEVINVVFLPDWQKKSNIFKDEKVDVWFEIVPLKNGMGEIEKHEMNISLYLSGKSEPSLIVRGTEFSETSFDSYEHNIGANCFHRSQRGK